MDLGSRPICYFRVWEPPDLAVDEEEDDLAVAWPWTMATDLATDGYGREQ